MVGVTGQVQQRRMVRQARDQSRVSRESDRNREQETGYRAQEKHNTKAESAGLNVP
ncbi:unnamed protein product [Staurois parvus]|uniref:Uncharacterized protein n=1 Tax=Staurois parvus TaxID=386267 RepID=A0ABN9FMH0_9NEOB|nr:unnamed protein product [Staurois parvus]